VTPTHKFKDTKGVLKIRKTQKISKTHVRKIETFLCQNEYIRKQKEPMNYGGGLDWRWWGEQKQPTIGESSGKIDPFDFLTLLEILLVGPLYYYMDPLTCKLCMNANSL
jgi:hypothetical protein